MANYHDDDFDYYEFAAHAAANFSLPAITAPTFSTQLVVVESKIATDVQLDDSMSSNDACTITSNTGNCTEHKHETITAKCDDWDSFYTVHNSAKMYKPRRYIEQEFNHYFSMIDNADVTVLEVGAGYGSTAFPLLQRYQFKYIATDYSQQALHLLKLNSLYDENRINTVVWDITKLPCAALTSTTPSIILSIFTLSAVEPSLHTTALQYWANLLATTGGFVLFRDYAEHDMTMYRHNTRLADKLFMRHDSTLAYYFTAEYLQQLASAVGFAVVEQRYATVCLINKKSGVAMHRVFLHAVLHRSAATASLSEAASGGKDVS